MIIIGIDPSLTSTGICVMTENGQVLQSLALSSKHYGVKRLSDFREMLGNLFYPYRKNGHELFIAIEGYSFASNTQGIALGELGGMMRLYMYELGIKCVEVPPTVVKKFATGKGNSDKIAMGVALQKQFGMEYPTSDQTDAHFLALIAMAYLGLMPNLSKAREAIIADMKAPKVKKGAKKQAK